MRPIALVVCAGLAMIASPAAAQSWQRIASNDDTVGYVDGDSIRNQGNLRQVRAFFVFSEPLDGRVLASTVQYEFDCGRSQFRSIEYSYFDLEGRLIRTEPSETIDEFETAPQGSISEALIESVCLGQAGEAVADPIRDAPSIFGSRQ